MNTEKITNIKVLGCDVFLTEYSEKHHLSDSEQGKITISSYENGAFTHYWGAMGCSLKEFLLSLDGDYFCKKLNPSGRSVVFNSEQTLKNVIEYLKESFELSEPFFREVEYKLSEITQFDESAFVDFMEEIDESDFEKDDPEKKYVVGCLNCEPWGWSSKSDSKECVWLAETFLPELKRVLKVVDE